MRPTASGAWSTPISTALVRVEGTSMPRAVINGSKRAALLTVQRAATWFGLEVSGEPEASRLNGAFTRSRSSSCEQSHDVNFSYKDQWQAVHSSSSLV